MPIHRDANLPSGRRVLFSEKTKSSSVDAHSKQLESLSTSAARDKKRFIPPINRIPVEILGEIFIQYAWGGDIVLLHEDKPVVCVSMNSRSDPTILGQVCGRWRDAVLSMPLIWSSLFIYKPSAALLPRIRLWLDRAGSCPLSLNLFQSNSDLLTKSEISATDVALSLFIKRFHQWNAIKFFFYGNYIPNAVLNLPRSPPAMLEEASVSFSCSRTSQNEIDRVWQILHSSVSLRSVRWRGFYDPNQVINNPFPNHIPWAQLTDISLPRLPVDRVISTLQCCASLEKLQITVGRPVSKVTDLPLLILPNLHDMKIKLFCDISPFINAITAPRLASLSLYNACCTDIKRSQDSLSRFITRSRCPLTALSVLDHCAAAEELPAYLQLPMPSLVKLTLMAHFDDRLLINAISCRVLENGVLVCPLPRLQNVELSNGTFSYEALASMILSRWHFHQSTDCKMISFRSIIINDIRYPFGSFLQAEGLGHIPTLNQLDSITQSRLLATFLKEHRSQRMRSLS